MNSKRKGAAGEREFAKVCREHGYDCRRGQQYNGLEGEDVVGLPGVHIEVKRVERLNIEEAMAQSKADAQGKIPIVAHRKNNCEWLITMRAEDWFKLYREWEAGQ
jgi:Holliday junction resolvase